MKIILADDEKDLSFIIKTALEKKGHQVSLDPNADLLDNLSTDLPNLILLDINLRNRDGGDLCSKLKEENHTKNIPIVLISGIMDLKQISEMCGAQGFLVKPFEIAELEKVVRNFS
jgi:DNA-binding response OmpR family regulator